MDTSANDDDTVRRPSAAIAGAAHARGEPAQSGRIDNAEAALPVGTRLREFEIQGVIGEGGFSIVYHAWDHSLHRSVALKEYIPAELAYRDAALRVTVRSQRHRPTFDAGLKSFVDEARLLANFDHRSLVKVHQFWEGNGTAFMVMPWYKGPTLKQALVSMGEPPAEAWLLSRLGLLTEALAVVHAENCYHRDISPDNIILVGSEQVPLLLDFGAARRIVGNLTQDLTVILKTGYAPIEQYGEIPGMRQGPWTDVYAIAAVTYFAMRGRTPPPAVGRAVKDTYSSLASTADDRYGLSFRQAVDHALTLAPERRTPSIHAFRLELGLDRAEVAASPRPGHSTPSGTAKRQPTPSTHSATRAPQRRKTVIYGSVASVAAIALAAVFQLRRPATPSEPAPTPASPTGSAAMALPSPQTEPDSARQTPSPALAPPATSDSGSVRPPPTSPDPVALNASRRAERDARRDMEQALAAFQLLGKNEKRDVSADVAAIKGFQERARAEAAAGQFDQAAASDRQGQVAASLATKRLAGELVNRYADLARRATEADQLGIAEQALQKAKKLDALRH